MLDALSGDEVTHIPTGQSFRERFTHPYIIIHRGYHPYWAQRVPYNVAFIELEEGLRMFSNIVGTPNEALRVGQKLKVAFEQRAEDLVVPVFEVVA